MDAIETRSSAEATSSPTTSPTTSATTSPTTSATTETTTEATTSPTAYDDYKNMRREIPGPMPFTSYMRHVRNGNKDDPGFLEKYWREKHGRRGGGGTTGVWVYVGLGVGVEVGVEVGGHI